MLVSDKCVMMDDDKHVISVLLWLMISVLQWLMISVLLWLTISVVGACHADVCPFGSEACCCPICLARHCVFKYCD